jgi:aspartyl-tRNA(Asn)/glutamyl-tRNA(Gln) amidotransferase subunit A
LATGSDIGGSIRVPASLSGVVGFKPPWARVPALPPYNLDQYCHDGPMARTVDDCALIEDAIAGRHWRDVASLPGPPKLLGAIGDCRRVRVAVCPTLGDWPLAAAVAANTQSVAVALAAAGCIVEQVSLPWSIDEIWAAAQAHFCAIMGTGIAHVEHAHGDLLSDYTRAFARDMTEEGLGFYEGLELEGRLWEPLGRIFESFDVLLCPTMATDGFLAGESYLEGGMTIGEGHVHHHILGAMTLPFNLFSRCPVLSVPSGRAANGVPTGVQVVARPYDDVVAFVVARAVEAAGFGFTHADWRPPIG